MMLVLRCRELTGVYQTWAFQTRPRGLDSALQDATIAGAQLGSL